MIVRALLLAMCPMVGLPDPRIRPWLTVAELASITGEGEKVIRAALERGQLPRLDVGRYVRIPTAALLQQLGMTVDEPLPDPTQGEGGNVIDPCGL